MKKYVVESWNCDVDPSITGDSPVYTIYKTKEEAVKACKDEYDEAVKKNGLNWYFSLSVMYCETLRYKDVLIPDFDYEPEWIEVYI